ncbi:ApbE family lipoprotein [Desulfovibrio sp. X2]|uniref:UPF0280 family protein n=1 Tax=Desulfovibrio sp. X2 TaxID=941449 RepID=UPI000358E169|nr:UPF0280 family protein [Desulfovibrio sp. X2]EPR42747.1 ApbE family lipoprotein [Desulfovibrio sp. X2]
MPAEHRDAARRYRAGLAARKGEATFQVVVGESDLLITATSDLSSVAGGAVRALRGQITSYAALHPDFLDSLSPLPPAPGAPEIVRRMCAAAAAVDVGPMAAVAGAVAMMTAEALSSLSTELLVENGGDLYCISTKERTIGLLADPAQGIALGVRVAADEFPVSFCSSSGRIGHSLSFGRGDLVAVRAGDACLADAAATALANRLGTSRDLTRVTDQAMAWEGIGIEGVFAQLGEKMAVWGRMELTAAALD